MRNFLFICVVLLSGCKLLKQNKPEIETPPGTLQIDYNLFCDQTEISNLHYREYTYWLGEVFGKTSDEYRSALPDSTVFEAHGSTFRKVANYYFTHPAYHDYPVVGISWEQAQAYTQWRSDRVFQNLLQQNGMLSDVANTKEGYFTIEKYLNGSYKNTQPNASIFRYPQYRLPSASDLEKMYQYSDSIMSLIKNKKRTKNEQNTTLLGLFPIEAVYPEVPRKIRSKAIHHLNSNVSEWSSTKDAYYGASWEGKKMDRMELKKILPAKSNAYVGFRNVCEWVTLQ